jgi:hypothetical protein
MYISEPPVCKPYLGLTGFASHHYLHPAVLPAPIPGFRRLLVSDGRGCGCSFYAFRKGLGRAYELTQRLCFALVAATYSSARSRVSPSISS